MSLNHAIKKVNNIGNEIVNCKVKCEGIINDPKRGIMPRGLYLEAPHAESKIGCIVVGINPGVSGEKERTNYIENSPVSYESMLQFFIKRPKQGSYFENTKKFIQEAGFEGAILWTDLCKCENKDKKTNPPTQTFRVCIKKFLKKELEISPSPPIIALGNKVFSFIALSFPERFVIGIPHPSGSRGQFWLLFDGNKRLKRIYKQMLKDPEDENGNTKCIKLFPRFSDKNADG